MTKTQQDTEITLGTGRMLGIFFAFVVVCAFFFAIGFSLGRKTASPGGTSLVSPSASAPSTVVRPSMAKADTPQASPQPEDFSFYKAVGEKNAGAALTSPDAKAQPAPSPAAAPKTATPKTATEVPPGLPAAGSYFVQVAAVTRKEDAESLVEALKKKQYPAFSASSTSSDRFYHVQVGPYAEMKEAEAMRARLVGDGYNPIVKK